MTDDGSKAGEIPSDAASVRRTRRTLTDFLSFSRSAAALVARGRPAYDSDEMLHLAAEAILHRIGEAIARLPQRFVDAHPEANWRAMKGMRNLVAHEYEVVDYHIVWNTLAANLPVEAEHVQRILRQLEGAPASVLRVGRVIEGAGAGASGNTTYADGVPQWSAANRPAEDPEGDTMKATWNGTVIAESDDTVVVEGNHYFPRASVRDDVLSPSQMSTDCPWKGQASYFNVEVDGQVNESAAFHYPEPKPAASQITDRVAFWHGVDVTA